MNLNENNWQMIFINFLLIGIILLLLFRVLRYSLPWLFRDPKKRDYVKKRAPLLEIGFWFVYLSWFTFSFAQRLEIYGLVVGGLLFILLFWFSKFFLREIIAGIIFKINGRYKKGDQIQATGHDGRINRFGLDTLEMESRDGKLIFIPYSRLVGDSIVIRSDGTEKATTHTFTILTAVKDDIAGFEREIQSLALTLPWISINKPLQAALEQFNRDTMTFRITLYLIDRNFAVNAEKAIRESFEMAPTNK